MKQFCFICIAIFFAVSCKKDPKAKEPQFFTFQGELRGLTNVATVAADGSILVCGSTFGDKSVWKIGRDGGIIWQKTFSGNMEFYGIVEGPDNSIYVCGYMYVNDSLGQDFMLMKLQPTGEKVWIKNYPALGNGSALNILKTKDGQLLMAGTTISLGTMDIQLIKADTGGVATGIYDITKTKNQEMLHTTLTTDGGYLITGTDYNPSSKCLALWRYDWKGNLLWSKIHGINTNGKASLEMADGSIITCGYQTISSRDQVIVQKSDKFGDVVWTKDYGLADTRERALDLKQDADGSIIITGHQDDNSGGTGSVILLKIDGEGNTLFSKKFKTGKKSVGNMILKDKNDDNIIVGISDFNIFTVRTDNRGNFK